MSQKTKNVKYCWIKFIKLFFSDWKSKSNHQIPKKDKNNPKRIKMTMILHYFKIVDSLRGIHFLIILLHGSLQGFLSYCNTLHISLHFLLHFLCIQAILHSSLQGLHGTEHFNLHFE